MKNKSTLKHQRRDSVYNLTQKQKKFSSRVSLALTHFFCLSENPQ
jgi:hypothetical protein